MSESERRRYPDYMLRAMLKAGVTLHDPTETNLEIARWRLRRAQEAAECNSARAKIKAMIIVNSITRQ